VIRWLAALLFALLASQSMASAEPVDPAYAARASDLLTYLKAPQRPEALFAPSFLEAVPPDQIEQVARQLLERNGKPLAVDKIEASGPGTGNIEIGYEQARVRMALTIEPQDAHRIIGLLITSTTQRDDGPARILADFAALPGQSSVLVARLDQLAAPVLELNPTKPLAIGSSFKLWILAEAAAQVKAGKRKWSDVISLGAPSLPSGISQDWPRATPMTLQGLATLMISISDNTATDTLLLALGRTAVGRHAPQTPAALPVLSTLEAFALKMKSNEDLRLRWENGNLDARQKLLEAEGKRLTRASVIAAALVDAPAHIATVEWFASPSDMARTMDELRKQNDPQALAILSIAKGLLVDDARQFAYIGYKGGSESGVIAMNFLVKNKRGEWYAICGAWNDPAAQVDRARFSTLMARAAALVR
jgi:hypothetical protein